MSFDEPAIKSKWYEIPLGPDCEQEQRGRLQFRGGSRSVSEQDRIDNNGEAAQKHIWKQRAENCKDQDDQNDATKQPDDSSYAYKLGMMFVNGAAKVVNNVADGGKQHRDTIKQLRADLDDSVLNCDKLERDVGNAKLWIAYYKSQNGSLVNQMEESNQKFSLERQSMVEKLMKFEEDAECSMKALAEVTRMKDALEARAEETNKSVTKTNNQMEEAQKKSSEDQESVISSKPTVHQATTSVQVEAIELPEAGWILTRELSEKLENKEAQLQEATRALMKSEEEAECCRKALDKVTKMKDALEVDAEETKATVMMMKNQIKEAQRKMSEYQEHIVLSKPTVHLTTTSVQVEAIELPDESSILIRELSEKLENKEAQLQDATRALMKSEEDAECCKKALDKVTKMKDVLELDAEETKATVMRMKNQKSEEDAECSRKALAEVRRMKDALELRAEETKETVTCMKNQIEDSLKKMLECQENVASSKPTLQLTTTSTQVEIAELRKESSILIRELSQNLKDKEDQLQDATRALRISVSHGEKLRDHLLMTSKSMHSQTMEMMRRSTALESAMNESCSLKAQLEEESLKRKGVEEELAEQQNQTDWRTHESCRMLDWRCREQKWMIQNLQEENIEFRRYFDNYSGYNSSHQYHHGSSCSATQHQQQSYYSYDQSNINTEERLTNGTDLGIIQQSNERASTPPSANAYIENLSSLPDANPQQQVTSTEQVPATVQWDLSLGDTPANYQHNNKYYTQILAREDAPSWKGEVSFSQDGGYSSSCNYYPDETQSHNIPIAQDGDSAITHSQWTDNEIDDVPQRHYYVSYKDVEFDMVALSLPQIRNVASASGAIATQAGINDFYDFLAQKIEEMDQDPHWRGVHKMGSSTAWLGFKQEE